MDSMDDLYQEKSFDTRRVIIQVTAILYTLATVLSAITVCMRTRGQTPPPPNAWHAVGFYNLGSPQTLPKRERAAATQYDGKNAVLYEKTYASGARAWRYSLNDHDWFYPTRTAVSRRGLTNTGDILLQE